MNPNEVYKKRFPIKSTLISIALLPIVWFFLALITIKEWFAISSSHPNPGATNNTRLFWVVTSVFVFAGIAKDIYKWADRKSKLAQTEEEKRKAERIILALFISTIIFLISLMPLIMVFTQV